MAKEFVKNTGKSAKVWRNSAKYAGLGPRRVVVISSPTRGDLGAS